MGPFYMPISSAPRDQPVDAWDNRSRICVKATRLSYFLTGALSDAEAVPSWRLRDVISVRDVPADALDLGEFELWNPCFPMLVHRSNLWYDAVALR